jgi:fused signal recognition particle receptor
MDTTLLIVLVLAAVLLVAVATWVVVGRRRTRAIGTELRAGRAIPAAPPRLADRLGRSRRSLGEALRGAFGRGSLDQGFWDALEEALIGVDVGVVAATRIVGRVRDAGPGGPDDARSLLRDELLAALSGRDRELHLEGRPAIVMVVGVNGTGKTTSIAKLAARLREHDLVPILGAADTFRAAADTQLRTWAERVGVEMVGGQEGADPAAVAFDALAAARARKRDVLVVDTAGRLHSKKNLMAELAKIRRVLEREGDRVGEVLLVLDATAGQNGVAQAARFLESAGVTGIVLSKLDGTARGGIVVAIEEELGIPVKYVGIGEGIEDLVPFDPEAFVDALLEEA